MPPDVELSVSQFVALLNQALDYTFPGVVITGELANLRVSKNRWVYFDLKDEQATVKFFGTVYQLPGPLEDGMLLRVRGQPRLHNLYGFSVNVESMQPSGEGTIKRAATLLQTKLAAEGLFDEHRKRPLPYPPARIGLVTSKQSAAYADFIKILNARWRGLTVQLIDVHVQGEPAPAQIAAAIAQFNTEAEPPEVIIVIRGGGSAEDLAAFNSEQVTRAVAGSRVPTLVAIGHEIDLSLAELAADRRASTPSNAAELLVPDRQLRLADLRQARTQLQQCFHRRLQASARYVSDQAGSLEAAALQSVRQSQQYITSRRQLLQAYDPQAVLRRGYAVVRLKSQAIRSVRRLPAGGIVDVELADGRFAAEVNEINVKGNNGG